MICKVEKRYLLVPVDGYSLKKKLYFLEGGTKVRALEARVSARADHFMPYDMREFLGRTLEITTQPECDYIPVFSDEPYTGKPYAEKYRPSAHFTARSGWINDPNGLILYEGRYHLFYQHNPVDTIWGNMHWGHAVSEDLVHWEELEEALFPDENGAMFSGSAIADTQDLTGLKCNEHDPLLLFYTAAGGACELSDKQSTQRLAYSTDGGKTFVKYPRAMIETVTPENRDPKVNFCEELGCFIMPIYLAGSEFAIYTSRDLLNWRELQRLTLEGDNECPDIYPLSLGGERYWVFTAAHDMYLIGKFTSGRFTPVQSVMSLHMGDDSYAAQTFSGIPEERRVRIAWNRSRCPGMPFNSSMSTPHEMSLIRSGDSLLLCARPCREYEALRRNERKGCGLVPLSGTANEILISAESGQKQIEVKLLGFHMVIDNGKLLVCGHEGITGEVPSSDGRYTMHIIQDKTSVEIWFDRGQKTVLAENIADYSLSSAECPGSEITVWELDDIHR